MTQLTIASAVAKTLAYKRESSFAVLPGTGSAQLLRRTKSTIDMEKATYKSQEIRVDRQDSDFRHGVRSVKGAIAGELSPGTYADFFRASLRQAFQAAVVGGTVAALTVSSTQPQYVRTSGNYITEGFKVGDVGYWTGGTASGTANNSKNFMISTLTGTAMGGFNLDGTDVVAAGTQASSFFSQRGKKTWTPSTGQVDDSFTFEHFFSDLPQSEVFTGCKVEQIGVALPPTGMATLDVQVMGVTRATSGTGQYFVAPAAQTNTGIASAVNGMLLVNGTGVATLTGLTMTIKDNLSAEPVVGQDTYPAIVQGKVQVEGQITALFDSGTLRDAFDNESELSLIAAVTVNETSTADFVSFVMPRVKLGGAAKDDGEKAVVQTIPFTALLNTAGSGTTNSTYTTLVVQDSQA